MSKFRSRLKIFERTVWTKSFDLWTVPNTISLIKSIWIFRHNQDRVLSAEVLRRSLATWRIPLVPHNVRPSFGNSDKHTNSLGIECFRRLQWWLLHRVRICWAVCRWWEVFVKWRYLSSRHCLVCSALCWWLIILCTLWRFTDSKNWNIIKFKNSSIYLFFINIP